MPSDHAVVRLLYGYSSRSTVGAGLAATVLGLVIAFRRSAERSPVLGFAMLEGAFGGVLSHCPDTLYPGVVVRAVVGTFAGFAAMLGAWWLEIVKVTEWYARADVAVAGSRGSRRSG